MLFNKGDRIPVFRPKCPLCGHDACGDCGETWHTERITTLGAPDGFRSVKDGNYCCACGGTWQEQVITASEDVP